MVLVPGLNVSSRHNARLAEYLAPHVRVFALDLSGYGQSDKPRHHYTLRDLSDFACVNPRAFSANFGAFLRYDAAIQRSIPARNSLPEPLPLAELDVFLAESGSQYAVRWE